VAIRIARALERRQEALADLAELEAIRRQPFYDYDGIAGWYQMQALKAVVRQRETGELPHWATQ
jgi:hypothetical protein